MKLTELQNKLIRAARSKEPSDRVPYAFEKRVMRHIASRSKADAGALWAQALWRSAIACVVVVLVTGSLSIFVPRNNSPTAGDLSQAFEKTMLAGLEGDYSR